MSDDAQRQPRFLGVSFYVMLVLAVGLVVYLILTVPHEMRLAQMFDAARSGNVADLERLLGSGLNPDEVDKQSGGSTLLMQASQAGRVEVVRTLLEHGAKADARYEPAGIFRGRTALMFVADNRGRNLSNGEIRGVLELLLQHGADINAVDEPGQSALLLAIQARDQAIGLFLVQRGANPNGKNWLGNPVLVLALESVQAETARLLVERGADVNAAEEGKTNRVSNGSQIPLVAGSSSKSGRTPLMLAVEKNLVEMVKLLLQKGARVNDRDKSGMTALGIALTNGNDKIRGILQAAGAKE